MLKLYLLSAGIYYVFPSIFFDFAREMSSHFIYLPSKKSLNSTQLCPSSSISFDFLSLEPPNVDPLDSTQISARISPQKILHTRSFLFLSCLDVATKRYLFFFFDIPEITLMNQGNVLIPCYSSGIIYDLLECLVGNLDASGLGSIPIFFISPVADQSLAYSNILAEWLTNSKQSRVYLPEEPFLHASFVRTGRVKHYSSVDTECFSNDFKNPCIVFTGHPCLRFGEVVHFIELWGNSSNNLIAFTEPEFPYLESLTPYQPLAMKVSYTPIDTSLNFVQANKLISETISPRFTVLPHQYTQPPSHALHRTDLMIDLSKTLSSSTRQVFPYKSSSESIRLPIKESYARVTLDSQVSDSLIPITVRPGVTIATLTASLQGRDNNCSLKPLTSTTSSWTPSQGSVLPPPSNYSWGSLDLQLFMQALTQAGLYDSRLEHTPTGTVIHLVSHVR